MKTKNGRWQVGAAIAGLVGMLSVWAWLGLPRVALSTDIEKLSLKQATIGVDLYSDRERALGGRLKYWRTEFKRTSEATERAAIAETINDLEADIRAEKRKIDAYNQRIIELSK